MEDVQDGKKVSIQDGVTEDPAIPKFTGKMLVTVGYDYGTILSAKSITTILNTMTDSIDKLATITTILETAVS